jgi:hypothetical protein
MSHTQTTQPVNPTTTTCATPTSSQTHEDQRPAHTDFFQKKKLQILQKVSSLTPFKFSRIANAGREGPFVSFAISGISLVNADGPKLITQRQPHPGWRFEGGLLFMTEFYPLRDD